MNNMKKIKIILLIIVTLLIILIGRNSCYAYNYAYSIGGKFATGEVHAGDDFSSNVITAANAYHLLSNTSSYYSNYPTYSYLSGSNGYVYRFGGSKIFFVNSHANYNVIAMATQSDSSHRIGIGYGYDDTITEYDQNISTTYNILGVLGRSLSGADLITYCGCYTAKDNDTWVPNLTNRSNQQGATSVVGWKTSIVSRGGNGPNWLQTYNYSLGYGYNLLSAINQAVAAYPNDALSTAVSISGSGSTVLGNINPPLLREAIAKNPKIKEIIKPIREKYNVIDVESKNYSLKNDIKEIVNINKDNEMIKYIIDEIKTVDDNFDINNYKISSNIVNLKEGTGHIFITYYIDGKIETNKVYVVYIENCKLNNITVAGIKKHNIDNISCINEENLIKIVSDFEANKKNEMEKNAGIKSIIKSENYLNEENKINTNYLKDGIELINEGYFFDYNENMLEYKIQYNKACSNLTVDGEVIKIELNKQ